MNSYSNIKPCVVIPVFNHERAIGAMVSAVLTHGIPCVLVDDGSSSRCAEVLDALLLTAPTQLSLVRHLQNQGKGAAVMSGFQKAADLGYSHALQIDADGQHCASDIPRFLALAEQQSQAVIIGIPIYDKDVPKVRLYARYLTHIWVWINTLSFEIKDSMCGFRVYPLQAVLALARRYRLGARMDFDSEVLVRLHWQGLRMVNVPTRVTYPSDGISHFRLLWDNLLISRMHTVLFFGMLLRAPRLLARKFRRRARQDEANHGA